MLKVDHIFFPVWDAAASLKFYHDVMGFTLAASESGDDWGGYPWLMLFFAAGDGREIVLVSLRGAKRSTNDDLARDVRHLAFAERSVSALKNWRRRLRKQGIEFWEERHGAQHSVYFEDPNGVVLEITAPPSRPAKTNSRAALAAARRWIGAKDVRA